MTSERQIHKTQQATLDVEQHIEYFHQQAGLAVALRFLDNAEQAFDQLLTMPRIGALLGFDELPYQDLRHWHINGFERLIVIYRELADGIEIVRVLHSSREVAALIRADAL